MNDKISAEYKKHKELRKCDVNHLIEWLEKQPHLPKLSEFQIIVFLHSCFFSLEQTKRAIDICFTSKTKIPSVFSTKNARQDIIDYLDVCLLTVLPSKTQDGCDIIYHKMLNNNPSLFNFPYLLALKTIILNLQINQNGTSNGIVCIFDVGDWQMGHFFHINPTLVKKYFFYLQEGLSIRLKVIHLINFNSIADKGYKMIKPFLKEDLINLIEPHSTFDTFLKKISVDVMPSDYFGGKAPSCLQLKEMTKNNLLKNAALIDEDERLTSDESKRITKSKVIDEMFGEEIQGSFKKLEID